MRGKEGQGRKSEPPSATAYETVTGEQEFASLQSVGGPGREDAQREGAAWGAMNVQGPFLPPSPLPQHMSVRTSQFLSLPQFPHYQTGLMFVLYLTHLL